MTADSLEQELADAHAATTLMAQRAGVLAAALLHAHVEHCRTACPASGRDIDDACRCGLTQALRLIGERP